MPFLDWLTSDRSDSAQAAFEDLQFMLRVGSEMFAAATAHLLDNEILDVDLRALDAEINAREEHLRSVVFEHLTAHPGKQLGYTLRLFSVVQEAERIGDLAKSIADASQMALGPRMGEKMLPLRDLRDRILQSFALTRDGFEQDDSSKSDEVLKRHVAIKADSSQMITGLAERTDISIRETVIFTLGIRLMSRTSSHLANIASTVSLPFEQIRRSGPESES